MEKRIKPAKTLGCSGVADGNPLLGGERYWERGMKAEIDTLPGRIGQMAGENGLPWACEGVI
jgi:hypothetical protein